MRVFGRYTLIGILGRGGMGVVWRARDDVLGEDVALKFLPDGVRWDPSAFEDLKQETRRARQLTHPNIVRIHDFVEDAGGAAISMELVEGQTLTALRLSRENKVLEPADLAPWLSQLCAALDYAHGEARVVHRDLKPSNVMLSRDGRVKVTDFGVARSLADSITRVSMMSAGTLVYMSPQQAMGEEPAPADDVYALGATLYELLTGKPPFHTGDVRLQLFQRRPESVAARRKALGVAGAAIPESWERTLAACLAKEPSDRPATVGEVARRLSGAEPAAGSRWRWRVSRRAVVTGLAAAVALAMGAVVLRSRREGWGGGGAGAVFASDRTRALAAWNFDADARDASGRGFDGMANECIPTMDRFGRIDRALKFNGNADAAVPDHPLLRWGGAQPFTAAIWVQHDASVDVTREFWRSEPENVGALVWYLGTMAGRLRVGIGVLQSDQHHCGVTAAARSEPGAWQHLAMVSDGTTLTLYVDGRVEGSALLGPLRKAPAPGKLTVRFGRTVRLAPTGFMGALDDARLWRRALNAEEVAALAARELPRRIVVTRGGYSDTDDLAVVVREEFGEGARILDWEELKRQHRDDVHRWADEMGLILGAQNAWLQRAGERFFEPKRHYFVSRFDGAKPGYFLAHDEMGGMTLALGSWNSTAVPVLASTPVPTIEREPLGAADPDGVIRRRIPFGTNRIAAAVSWRGQISATVRSGWTVRLHLVDGRQLRGACEIETNATAALTLGVAGGAGISRKLVVGFGECEFTFVVRDGQLRFRAMRVIGDNPLFDERMAVEGLRLSDVIALEVEGGGPWAVNAARLTIE